MDGFVKISRYAGMREDLVQAGGGNSSYKISDDRMAIKASGFQLADITNSAGYALVNQRIIKDSFLKCKSLEQMTDSESKAIINDAFIEGSRPSIETFLHAVSGKYTLHTHPVVVNALTCRKDGMSVLKDMFPDALLVPYATPGVELAKLYFKEYRDAEAREKCCDIVFLQNHGLVVSADTADEVIEKTEDVVKKLETYLGIDNGRYRYATKLWEHFPNKIVYKVNDASILEAYEQDGAWNHVFCPDCVVFLGKKFLSLKNDFSQEDIDSFLTNFGLPSVVIYDGSLYIIADSVKKAQETQSVMSFSAQVMQLNKGCECNMLSDAEQNFLLNWDAEKYRKSMK